ncbi:uncharacterized protein EMH_0076120 [Eimeria mitis]|uniref:Uncharacterized protein n=1 Tax=Eimeria mitis TaxID=44415 RepID=U6KCC0_9EIME|nr:uncharacterized protein EMH_0076120 [Eimeria mitis]CDJ35604.1 hypothetical protein, conserved [Eimeria mitis]
MLEDTGGAVEKFISGQPTKDALLAAAATQRRLGFGPVDDMPMQGCGLNPMARVYSPEEVIRRLQLSEPPCYGPVDDIIREYNLYVTEHTDLMNKMRETVKRKPHKSLRLAFIQWNALMIKPSTFQVLAPFLNQEKGFNPDDVDVVTIVLQENMKLDSRRERRFLTNIQTVLNLLSTTANWGPASISYLGNIRGTQAKAILTPNTQSLIYIMRETHQPDYICNAEQSVQGGEKGFIGAVFGFPGLGKLAVLGSHLKGWKAKQFENVFPDLLKQCGSPHVGLDSFSLGVVFGADFNEHLHFESLTHLYNTALQDPDRYPAFAKVQTASAEESDNIKMTRLLTEALAEPLDIIASTYEPLIWSVDRLVCDRMSVIADGQHEFVYGICGMMTLSQGHSPFSVLKKCLAPKVFASRRGVGYLDRVTVRLSSESTAVLDRMFEAGGMEGEVPSTFASITSGLQVYDMRSDHVQVANIIEFLKVD